MRVGELYLRFQLSWNPGEKLNTAKFDSLNKATQFTPLAKFGVEHFV